MLKRNNLIKIVHTNSESVYYEKALIGIVVGFLSGLFAAGGGLVLVPMFTYVLKLDEKEARATTLFCILPMVLLTAVIYSRNDFIDWSLGINVLLVE